MKKTNIGGQAVIEGVMIQGSKKACMAVRRKNGSITLVEKELSSFSKKHAWARLPIIRGCINLVTQLKMGYGMLMRSADYMEKDELAAEQADAGQAPVEATDNAQEDVGINDVVEDVIEKDEEEGSKMGVLSIVAMVLGVGLAIGLFFILPSFIAGGILPQGSGWMSLAEGGVRLLILIGYMLACSLMKDMYRVFQYHGAEHKVLHCYEHDLEPTPENARKFSTVHPRCGTSYLFLVMIVSILVFSLIGNGATPLMRVGLRLLLLPLVAGIAYEVLKLAAKSDGILAKIVRAPGLLLQRLTTKPPEDDMIEVAAKAFFAAAADGEV